MGISNIALAAGMISGCMGILTLIVGIRLYHLYLKKKRIEGLYLCLSVFSYLFTILSATIVYLGAGISISLAVVFQKGIYVGVFLSMMFTFLLGSKIFFTPKKILAQIYFIVGIIAVLIIVIFDSSEISVFPDGSGYPLLILKIEYGILLVGYIIPTVLGISIIGLKVSKKTEDPVFKKSFLYISYGILTVLLTFVFDQISSSFKTHLFVYSLFLYLTWVPPVFGVILYDRGYTLPDRMRSMSSEKEIKK